MVSAVLHSIAISSPPLSPEAALIEALLAQLAAAPEGVSLPRLCKRLDVRMSVLMRTLAWLGEGSIGGVPGMGWVRTVEDGERTLALLTPAGRQHIEESSRNVPGCAQRRIWRWRNGQGEEVLDAVAEEMPIAMRYNGRSFAVMMATPCDLEDFALGFSLSEGLIADPTELLEVEIHEHLEGMEIAMRVSADAPAARLSPDAERLLPGRGGCGICGTREMEAMVRVPAIVNAAPVSAAALATALEALPRHQAMNALTGSVHAAAWADAQGRIELVREDVGRHNALDKLTGAMWREGRVGDNGLLLISSRASYEMVVKAARAGIGFVAAVSAPTALAIGLAQSAGVCLVGFARAGGYNVYTHSDRLIP